MEQSSRNTDLQKMTQVVEADLERTFNEFLKRKLNLSPAWLYRLYNDFTRVKEDFTMSLREKKRLLLEISKELFVKTAVHVDMQMALAVRQRAA